MKRLFAIFLAIIFIGISYQFAQENFPILYKKAMNEFKEHFRKQCSAELEIKNIHWKWLPLAFQVEYLQLSRYKAEITLHKIRVQPDFIKLIFDKQIHLKEISIDSGNIDGEIEQFTHCFSNEKNSKTLTSDNEFPFTIQDLFLRNFQITGHIKTSSIAIDYTLKKANFFARYEKKKLLVELHSSLNLKTSQNHTEEFEQLSINTEIYGSPLHPQSFLLHALELKGKSATVSLAGKTFFPRQSTWPFSEKPAKIIFEIDGKSELQPSAFELITKMFHIPIDIDGTLSFSISGKGSSNELFLGQDFFEKLSSFETSDIKTHISFEKLSIDNFHIGDIQLQLQLNKNQMKYDGSIIPTLSPHHKNSGKIYFQGVTETQLKGPSTANVSIENIDFANLLENLTVSSWVQFFASGNGNFSGTLWPFHFSSSHSQVKVEDFRVYNNVPHSLHKTMIFHTAPVIVSGPFQISAQGANLDNISVIVEHGTNVSVSGNIFFDLEKGMNLQANVTHLMAKDFSPVSSLILHGSGNGKAKITGPYTSLDIEGNLLFQELKINDFPIGNMQGTVTFRNNILSLNSFEGNVNQGNYLFSGNIDFHQHQPTLFGEANIKNINLNYLSAISASLPDHINGFANLSLLLSGNTENPVLEYRAYAPKFSVFGITLSHYAISGKFENQQFAFSWNHRPFENISSEISQNFSGNIIIGLDQNAEIKGSAEFNNWIFSEVINHQSKDYHLPTMAGIWTQNIFISGLLSNPILSIKGNIRDLSLYKESFSNVGYDCDITPQYITFYIRELNQQNQRFHINGKFSLIDNRDFILSGNIQHLDWLSFFPLNTIDESEKFESSISGDFSLNGHILPTMVFESGTLKITKLSLDSEHYHISNDNIITINGNNALFILEKNSLTSNLGNITFSGKYHSNNSDLQLNFSGNSDLKNIIRITDNSTFQGKLHIDGKILADKENSTLNFSAHFPHIDYRYEPVDLQLELQNTNVSIEISKLFSSQPYIDDGQFLIQNIKLQSNDYLFTNERPFVIMFDENTATLQPFNLNQEKYHLSIAGEYHFDDNNSKVTTNGSLPITLFIPHNDLLDAQGIVDFRISHSGTFKTPYMNGEILLNHATMTISESDHTISEIEGKVSFKESTLRLSPFKALYRGEQILAEGEAKLSNYHIERLSLQTKIPKIPISLQDITIQTGGNLLLSKTGSDYLLSGELELYHARYSKNIQWDQLLLKFQEDSLTPIAEAISKQQLLLNVSLMANDSIQIRNSFAEIDLGGSLKITGTMSHPGLVGELSLRKGEAIFRNRKYQLRKGKISFGNLEKIIPIYSLTADTTACESTITVMVDGIGFEFPKYFYQSNPSLSANDIPTCLLLGLTASQFDQSKEGNISSFGAEALWNISGLEKNVENIIPLSINVTTAYSSISQTFEPRIVATKNLLKGQLKLRYDSSLLNTTEQQVSARYLMSQRLSLQSDWNNTSDLSLGNLGFDVHYQWKW